MLGQRDAFPDDQSGDRRQVVGKNGVLAQLDATW
jgi:hypothetical protein